MTDERLLLRPSEAAARLGIGRSTLYQLIARGEIRVLKIGAATRIPVWELERFVRRLAAEQGVDEPR
jgi:excisionase family DNA binding protein